MIRTILTALLLSVALAAYWRLLRRLSILARDDDAPRMDRTFDPSGSPAGRAMIVPSG